MKITFEAVVSKRELEQAMGQSLDNICTELEILEGSAGRVYLNPSYYDCDDWGDCARVTEWMNENYPSLSSIWIENTY